MQNNIFSLVHTPSSSNASHQRPIQRILPTGTITLLFVDIENAMELLQDLNQDRYAGVLADYQRILRSTFQAHSGHEVDFEGESFFIVFVHASDAVLATVDAQRAFARHPWPDGVALRVRMALHTGEPQRISEGYIGLDLHHTARIMSAGHGGQILLSQTTHGLVEHTLPDGVSVRDLGKHRLKDLQHPSHLFQLVIADLPADFPPLKSLDTHNHNLPIQPTSLIGRQREIANICQLLRRQDVRLVTLTGPGGTGKTRLALQVAAELSEFFTDGVFFVDLAPLSNPDLVVPTIAQTLGIREVGGVAYLQRLKEELRQKQMLLLLDNFEQLLDAALDVVELCSTCPRLKILVTSRQALHVRVEQECIVLPLNLPDPKNLPTPVALAQYESVALFIDRAQAVKHDFQLTAANALAIAEVCNRLDGLPLAIELAAARSKVFSPQVLLARLHQRLEVLTQGPRDVHERQRTLRNTLTWSYQLLDADEQKLFRRLSVFAGGFTYSAAEALCAALGVQDGQEGVVEGLTSLIEKSLLQGPVQDDEDSRLGMLETIREYACECLEKSGELQQARRAHAELYLGLAEEADPQYGGVPQPRESERLDREYDNLRAVMGWSLQQDGNVHALELALRLGCALSWFWQAKGYLSEEWKFMELALTRSEGVATELQAKAFGTAASLIGRLGDLDRAEMCLEKSLSLLRELGDTDSIAERLRVLGYVAQQKGDFERTHALYDESLALFRTTNNQEGIYKLLHNMAFLAQCEGDYEKASGLFREKLARARARGDLWDICDTIYNVAQVLFVGQFNPPFGEIHSLLNEGISLATGLGYTLRGVDIKALLGWVSLLEGDMVTARLLLDECLLFYRKSGRRPFVGLYLPVVARIQMLQGDYVTAYSLFEEALVIGREVGDIEIISPCLLGMAELAIVQKHYAQAVRILGANEKQRETAARRSMPPIDRVSYEHSLTAVHAVFEEETFVSLWVEGRAMSLDDVLAVWK